MVKVVGREWREANGVVVKKGREGRIVSVD